MGRSWEGREVVKTLWEGRGQVMGRSCEGRRKVVVNEPKIDLNHLTAEAVACSI